MRLRFQLKIQFNLYRCRPPKQICARKRYDDSAVISKALGLCSLTSQDSSFVQRNFVVQLHGLIHTELLSRGTVGNLYRATKSVSLM